jgi:hypothetical protein
MLQTNQLAQTRDQGIALVTRLTERAIASDAYRSPPTDQPTTDYDQTVAAHIGIRGYRRIHRRRRAQGSDNIACRARSISVRSATRLIHV